jgi:hypothetical protein
LVLVSTYSYIHNHVVVYNKQYSNKKLIRYVNLIWCAWNILESKYPCKYPTTFDRFSAIMRAPKLKKMKWNKRHTAPSQWFWSEHVPMFLSYLGQMQSSKTSFSASASYSSLTFSAILLSISHQKSTNPTPWHDCSEINYLTMPYVPSTVHDYFGN